MGRVDKGRASGRFIAGVPGDGNRSPAGGIAFARAQEPVPTVCKKPWTTNQTPTARPAASAAPTNTLIRSSTRADRARSDGATETRSLGPTKTSRARSRRSAALTSTTRPFGQRPLGAVCDRPEPNPVVPRPVVPSPETPSGNQQSGLDRQPCAPLGQPGVVLKRQQR